MIPLKQFIPQEICLGCDICCRFSCSETVWAPKFLEEEIKQLVDNNILPPTFFTERCNNISHHINLEAHKDYFICPCFNTDSNKCKIYLDRPLECRLYPFLLIKNKGGFYLTYDKKCIYMKDGANKDMTDYIEYLKKEFQKKENIDLLRMHKELFSEYPLDDIAVVSKLGI